MKSEGCTGKILRFGLTTPKVTVEDLQEEWASQFIGRSGLFPRFSYEMINETTDPLDLDNLHEELKELWLVN